MITENILREWYSENAHRAFPLADTANGLAQSGEYLPTGLLVGMTMGVPSTMLSLGNSNELKYTVYLRRAVITSMAVQLTFAAMGQDSSSYDIGYVEATMDAISQNPQGGYSIASLVTDNQDLFGITGSVYFGPVEVFVGHGGLYILDQDSGRVALECINVYPDCVRSLQVNDTNLTGDIVLQEGPNISFNLVGNTLTIDLAIDADTAGFTSRDDLLNAIIETFGQPITTINNIAPDKNGNFYLTAEEGDCCTITPVTAGVTISNPCATPCCDQSILVSVVENIDALNTRASRLSSYLTAVTNNLNTLQNELSILKINLNQQ